MQYLSEAQIINLFKQKHTTNALDNDAAVIYHEQTMLTTSQDTLNEHTHFKLNFCPPDAIAHRCFTANLSDMAAMGLSGHYLLQSISLPPHTSKAWLSAYATALESCCQQHNIQLIGGDTTRLNDHISITMTIMDIRRKTRTLTRTGIQPEDIIYVSGPLGLASVGLYALQHKHSIAQTYLDAFLYPKAQSTLGERLRPLPAVHACMDITDGLAQDLTKLCGLNALSATIQIDTIPTPLDWHKTCQHLKLDPIHTQITGGEDYVLLVVGTAELGELSQGNLQPIGYFHNTSSQHHEVSWLAKGALFDLKDIGFKHF